MIPTIETISVLCLTEDQENGDLILDLMVDGISMVSYFLYCLHFLCFHQYFTNCRKTVENKSIYNIGKNNHFIVCTDVKRILKLYHRTELKSDDVFMF